MFHTIKLGELEYEAADSLAGAAHCFTTRSGGVSQGHLHSLNLGVHRGDLPERVLENYARLGSAVGFRPEETVFTMQRHTDVIRTVTKENCGEGLFRDVPQVCDGLITDCPQVALVVFSADCTPVLLFDPVRMAAGAIHAGWRGTALGIAAKAVDAMVSSFGCRREDIRAAIGPSIGPCCFETDQDVPQAMLDGLGEEARTAICKKGDKFYVDNKLCNALWLRQAGVTVTDISSSCTRCAPERFWSHRAAGDKRGSLAAVIRLPGGACQ